MVLDPLDGEVLELPEFESARDTAQQAQKASALRVLCGRLLRGQIAEEICQARAERPCSKMSTMSTGVRTRSSKSQRYQVLRLIVQI